MTVSYPRLWTDQEIIDYRDQAEKLYVSQRRTGGPKAYFDEFDVCYATLEPIFKSSSWLTEIDAVVEPGDQSRWHSLRYLCAPPISEEDFWSLVGQKFKRIPKSSVNNIREVIDLFRDVRRFPWLEAGRQPTAPEKQAAMIATATVMAHEGLRTKRRNKASRSQEELVSNQLSSSKFTLNHARKPITTLDQLARGEFSRERKVAGAKCDIPVRLRDGRLLAIECKVSNTPKNSWKRLQREVGGKSERWRQQFGVQVITGAVLSGVYDASCVISAQRDLGVYIFWETDLSSLREFVCNAT